MGASRLNEILQMMPAEAEKQVQKTCKRLNLRARDLVRRATGLNLTSPTNVSEQSQKPERITVSVEVVPGLPTWVPNWDLRDSTDLASRLVDIREHIESCSLGLPIIRQRLQLVRGVEGCSWEFIESALESFPKVEELLRILLDCVRRGHLVSRILAIDNDVLGAYFPPGSFGGVRPEKPLPRIEIYWAVIALVAGFLGVSIEALTAVVLLHELAHAHHHMGFDIDGRQWRDWAFASTDRAVIEGLAQFYTHVLAHRLEDSIDGVFEAYQQLLPHLPESYHTHYRWLKIVGGDSTRTPTSPRFDGGESANDYRYAIEVVRFAMLTARNRRGATSLLEFEEALKDATSRLNSEP